MFLTSRRVNPRDWDRAPARVARARDRLPKLVRQAVNDVAREVTQELRAAVRGSESQIRLRLRRLSPSYLARKGEGSTLFRLGEYHDAIILLEREDGASIGLRDGRHEGTTISYVELARFLENGTRRMPALPHWGPAANFSSSLVRRRTVQAIRDALRGD